MFMIKCEASNKSTTRQTEKKKKTKKIQPKENKKNTIDINITQMMVGKQWVKSWSKYRWAGEASIQLIHATHPTMVCG